MPAIAQGYHTVAGDRHARAPTGAIFSRVSRSKSKIRACVSLCGPIALLAATASAVGVAAPALATAAAPGKTSAATSAPKTGTVPARALDRSRELWATIDVCSPPDQLNTVGVRGSMPGDRQAHDTMYMSFRLQYVDSATGKWVERASGAAAPTFVAVGTGKSARQAGRSFQLVPVAGKPAFTLRGVVSFQWRRGKTVVHAVSRPTTAGQLSLAGADPAGFSAASCVIG
jgi:hypothetical protein